MKYSEAYGKTLRGREKGLQTDGTPRTIAGTQARLGNIPFHGKGVNYSKRERLKMFGGGEPSKTEPIPTSGRTKRMANGDVDRIRASWERPNDVYMNNGNYDMESNVRNSRDRMIRSRMLKQVAGRYAGEKKAQHQMHSNIYHTWLDNYLDGTLPSYPRKK